MLVVSDGAGGKTVTGKEEWRKMRLLKTCVRTALGPERDRVSITPRGSGRFNTCYKPFDTAPLKLCRLS